MRSDKDVEIKVDLGTLRKSVKDQMTKYITQQMSEKNEKKKTILADTMAVWNEAQRLLSSVQDTLDSVESDKEHMNELVNYFERIKVNPGFLSKNTTLGQLPKKDLGELAKSEKKQQSVPASNLRASTIFSVKDNEGSVSVQTQVGASDVPSTAFPENIYNDFIGFYKQISKYNEGLSKSWHFSYPLTNGEVMRQGIGGWQNAMMEVNLDPQIQLSGGMKDFLREYKIEGQSYGKDVDAIVKALDQLVAKADKDPQNQTLLKEWLIANGGQQMNRFFDRLLFDDKEFSTGDLSYAPVTSVGRLANWTMGEDGHLQFEYKCDIYDLTVANLNDPESIPASMVREADGNVHMADTPIDKEQTDKYLPLIQYHTQIELEIVDGKVKPKITQLDVAAFGTDALLSPQRKFGAPEQKEEVKEEVKPTTYTPKM